MKKQKHTHHYSFGALLFLPLFLLGLAGLWGNMHNATASSYFAERADRAEQKLHLAKTQFLHVQKVYSMLTKGTDEEIAHPVMSKASTVGSSPLERYTAATRDTKVLTQRVEAFKARINEIGKKVVYVDLSDQEISLVDNGEIVARYPASSGAPETPTPRGNFQIHSKQDLRVSSQEIPYRMPNYIAFTKSQSHGLHALPYLGNVQTNSDYWHEARSHIGIPVSHGCVRLLPEDAVELYQMVEVGTAVVINT